MKMPEAFSFSPFLLPRDTPHIPNAHAYGMCMPFSFSPFLLPRDTPHIPNAHACGLCMPFSFSPSLLPRDTSSHHECTCLRHVHAIFILTINGLRLYPWFCRDPFRYPVPVMPELPELVQGYGQIAGECKISNLSCPAEVHGHLHQPPRIGP